MHKFFLGAAAVLALAGTAFAAPHTYRSSVANGAWNDQNSWEYEYTAGVWHSAKTDGVPAPATGDAVTIRNSYPILVNAANAAIAALTVDASAVLTVSGGYSLTMDSGGSAGISGTMIVSGTFYSGSSGGVNIYNGGTVDINGGVYSASATTDVASGAVMVMQGTSPTLTLNNTSAVLLNGSTAKILVESSAFFTGSGEVRGNFDNSSIQIGTLSGSTTVLLTNYAVIAGGLTIQRNATNGSAVGNFANTNSGGQIGIVKADNAGTILFASTLNSISDDSSDSCGSGNAHWESLTSSVLRFDKAASLSGDFYVPSGVSATLTCNAAVSAEYINSPHGTVNGSSSFTSGTCP
jgi:hypothetical protein